VINVCGLIVQSIKTADAGGGAAWPTDTSPAIDRLARCSSSRDVTPSRAATHQWCMKWTWRRPRLARRAT